VAEEDRSRIFERFYRAASARSMPGSGLGLAIVQQAVSSHCGVVSVGEAPGGGALFTIGIPSPEPVAASPWQAPAAPVAPPPPPSEPEVLHSHPEPQPDVR
jgi:two-component system sensor histidine kinase MprB